MLSSDVAVALIVWNRHQRWMHRIPQYKQLPSTDAAVSPEPGGTTGILVDNAGTATAAQQNIYFLTLGEGAGSGLGSLNCSEYSSPTNNDNAHSCAVGLTQGLLN